MVVRLDFVSGDIFDGQRYGAYNKKINESDLENYKKISQHPLDEAGASRTECWIFKAK